MKESQDQITKIIEWYHNIRKGYQDIALLIDARRKLSTLSFFFAEETGEVIRSFNECYFLRKTNQAKARLDAVAEGNPAGLAESMAEYRCAEYRRHESGAEGNKDRCRLIMNQINEVLSSMSQQIAFLRSEKEKSNYQK